MFKKFMSNFKNKSVSDEVEKNKDTDDIQNDNSESEDKIDKIRDQLKSEIKQAESEIKATLNDEIEIRKENDNIIQSTLDKIENRKIDIIEKMEQNHQDKKNRLEDLNKQLDKAIIDNKKEEIERLLVELTK